ncbi:hypothetical protein GSI_12003 [Ganoderma sinense ZZ0214-1]|uniref:Uncharacterized protein n=1 Tax=Ganoderma sinense ZZ0214-1 TaxID=1077348 RepID=A0A2G8RXN4_9APHY|nr:hypothetical protein GSI_12003 [Ganoderma sinense ZZ0214-1]
MSEESDSDLPGLIEDPLPFPASPPSPALNSSEPTTGSLPLQPPYDFENEPEEVWDTYSLPPRSRRRHPQGPVELNFTRRWLNREDRGFGNPPRSVGMQVKMGTIRIEIELPKTFKHAQSVDPAAYRDFWRALRACTPSEQLSSRQKEVICGTLAAARFFCDDTITTRRIGPASAALNTLQWELDNN